jgi:hypothetical protein
MAIRGGKLLFYAGRICDGAGNFSMAHGSTLKEKDYAKDSR